MENRYSANFFVIANTREKLDALINILKRWSFLGQSGSKIHVIAGIQPGTHWYYATGWAGNRSWMPSEDSWSWKSAFKECGLLAGRDGAVIANVTDSSFAEFKGNEISESEHVATTPKGGMLDYDTYHWDEDDAELEIPHGYEKFKKSFIRVYSEQGSEMFDIYDKRDNSTSDEIYVPIEDPVIALQEKKRYLNEMEEACRERKSLETIIEATRKAVYDKKGYNSEMSFVNATFNFDRAVGVLDKSASVTIKGKHFVLAGLSDFIKEEIEKRGGKVFSSMGKTADYLVLNLKGGHGLSIIEKALEWRQKGVTNMIISDYQLWQAMLIEDPSIFIELRKAINSETTVSSREVTVSALKELQTEIADRLKVNWDITFDGKKFAFVGFRRDGLPLRQGEVSELGGICGSLTDHDLDYIVFYSNETVGLEEIYRVYDDLKGCIYRIKQGHNAMLIRRESFDLCADKLAKELKQKQKEEEKRQRKEDRERIKADQYKVKQQQREEERRNRQEAAQKEQYPESVILELKKAEERLRLRKEAQQRREEGHRGQ